MAPAATTDVGRQSSVLAIGSSGGTLTSPLGNAVDTFIRREDAERFIAEVGGDDSGSPATYGSAVGPGGGRAELAARNACVGALRLGELGELLRQPLPICVGSAADVPPDDPALGVDQDDVRLVLRTEGACPHPSRIVDGRPVPVVPLDERTCLVSRAGDVDPEKRDLRMLLLESCVGDRLALTDASPRRPDVDEDSAASEVRERDVLPVDGYAFDRRRRVALRSGLARRIGLARRLAPDRSRDAEALVAPGTTVEAVGPRPPVEEVVARAAAEQIGTTAAVHAIGALARDDDVSSAGPAQKIRLGRPDDRGRRAETRRPFRRARRGWNTDAYEQTARERRSRQRDAKAYVHSSPECA